MSFAGKILRVNLTARTVATENLSADLVAQYIGGRGLATKMFCDEVSPGVDALSPENKLFMATGPLTGTTAPTGGRYMVVTKSPLTNLIASSNSGGFFGAKLKFSGFDMIVFEGKASAPVYLQICGGKGELKDAAPLWGKSVDETTDILVAESGEKTARVACIGPAGEKQVLYAAIMNDKARAAGRSGVGAVMGSKNLKAVVISKTPNFKPAPRNVDAFKAAVKNCMEKIKQDAVTSQALPALGTKVLDNIINSNGMYPTRNFQDCCFEDVDEVSGEALVEKGYLTKNSACFACPIACGRKVTLPSGHEGEGPEYESGWSFGAMCGVKDLIAITQANFMCNELGLDTISTGVTIGTAMELYERGLIKKEELGKGPELKFGNSEALIYYTRKIALREGIGNKMADGSYRLAAAYGRPDLSMSVKKQELPAYDPRGVQGQGLAYATSNRGGCHVRAYLIAPEILAHPEKLDPQSLDGKAAWVKIFQDLSAAIDSAGLCLFTSFAWGADEYAALLAADQGANITAADVLTVGERIWNLERKFNLEAGMNPADDTLPKRLLNEPLKNGPNAGKVHRLPELLPEYYKLRGWSTDGRPTHEKLAALGI